MKKILITLLSGLVSLLPLIVVVFLLSKAFVCMKWLSQPLEALLPEDTLPAHIAANLAALVLLLLLLLVIGWLTRHLGGSKIDKPIETFLARIIPGYTFVRGLSAQVDGDEDEVPVVLVRQDDGASIGFEMERNENGWVGVFLPGSPQPWSGSVMVINADRVLPLNMTYAKALYMFQQMGKGSTAYLPDVNEEIKRDGLVQGHPVKDIPVPEGKG